MRASVIERAIETAHASADNSKNVIKIFIAPEFYWRGPTGAYPASSILDPAETDQKNPINMIGRLLEKIVSNSKYSDWLFVFGTVVAINDMVPDDILNNVPGSQKLFYNFAPIYKGGKLHRGKMLIAPKRYISKIDFLKSPVNAGEIIDVRAQQYDNTAWSQLQDWLKAVKGYELVQHNWFKVDQLQFSIEVCLDHRKQEALRSAWEGHTKRGAQISIVTSAGMSPLYESYVMSKGGHLFLQDGLGESISYQVSRVSNLNYLFNDPTILTPSQSIYSTASCTVEPCFGKEISVFNSPDEAIEEVGKYFSNSTWPTVRIFNKVSIQKSQRLLSSLRDK